MEVRETEVYARWFSRLRDSEARARIQIRIRRLSLGNSGDVRPIGNGVLEMCVDYGPGYERHLLKPKHRARCRVPVLSPRRGRARSDAFIKTPDVS